MSLGISAYVADSKAEAVREMGPYHLYFNQTLFSHGNFTETELQRQTGYATAASTDYVSLENRRAAQFAREDFRGLTMADVERQAEQMPWGTAGEVTERIIEAADTAGADNVQISLVLAQGAYAAPLFVPGSTFQVQATNAPLTFTQPGVNLAAGTQSLDAGLLNLTISLVAQGSAEWLVFSYETGNGSAIGNQGQNWSVNEVGLDAAEALNFIGAYVAFNALGVNQPATSSIFAGYSPGANPVPGGTGSGLVNLGFVAPVPAGPLGALGTFINPWNFLDSTGINSANVTGYTEALEFAPQVTPPPTVPEPASLALLCGGLVGLGLIRRRKIR